MNKGISKWPSRALNLLVVLAMVISLSAILVAPPVLAQTADCNPTPVYQGPHLDVGISTYIKNGAGDFIPETDFARYDCFYVNAIVVNVQANSTAIAPVNATISFPDGHIVLHEGEVAEKTWVNGNLTNASPAGLLADFWWQVCCNEAAGLDTIMVTAEAVGIDPAVGCTEVNQSITTEEPCLEIEIVEAPGMADKVGHLGNYTMSTALPVSPCQNFGIKAEITNTCDGPLTDVTGIISWTGPASIVGGDPLTWEIGTLAPGETKGVAWTLHCDGPGPVVVTVDSNVSPNHKIDNPWTVQQATPGGIEVTITEPVCIPDCVGNCTIKQPTGDCGAENFLVKATVTNNGDSAADNIFAVVGIEPPNPPNANWAKVQTGTPSIIALNTLAAHQTKNVQFNLICLGTGVGNVTVTAYSATDPLMTDVKKVTISQQGLIATVSPDPAFQIPDEVNKCQEFNVTFRYMNYSGNALNDPATGNITACINWKGVLGDYEDTCGNLEERTGNATLIDSVYYRRVVGGVPEGWILLTSSPVVTGNDTIGYSSCVHIPVICDCCGVEVRWRFQCTKVGPVQFSSTINVSQTAPFPFTASDSTGIVCVNQVWKAHLMVDSFFFIQTASGEMLIQDAVVPGTLFHVVIPVINTGDADAQNVQVYFTLTGAPEAPCTASFRIVSTGHYGDATSIVAQGGGAYIATFPVIPAHKAMKATLTLECLCEGGVSVWVPDAVAAWGTAKGVRGYDENTGALIPQDNIIVPPCPRVMEQIPFTIEILNPYTCQTFYEGQTFPVKARITNGASEDLHDVYATLTWRPGDNVALVGNQTLNPDSHSNTKLVGNITADSYTEITWVLKCTGASYDGGEVYLGVSAAATTPLLTAYTAQYPYTVNVHQIGIPTACLEVRILSPAQDQVGQDWDVGHEHAMIATGQEFAVTAKIMNNGNYPAENVIVTIDPSCGTSDYVTLADGQNSTIELGTLGPDDFVVETWTLWGGGTSDWGLKDCNVREDTICVNATSTTKLADQCPTARTWGDGQITTGDSVDVSIYPAAFLVAEITDMPLAIPSGSDFVVSYKVTNYGVADAWNTSVTLGVNPDGSVRIAAGEGGYTQHLGTIPGWSWGAPYNDVEGNFTVSCKQVCQSTLTIIPAGDDECGWHALVGYDTGDGESEPQYNWVQFAGLPIQSRFIIPGSETVKQLDNGQLDLNIAKRVDNAFPTAGQIVNFTVTVTNNGPTAASGVEVTDNQPSGLTFGTATASQGTYTGGVWTVGNLLVGGSATLVIPATVGSTGLITNTAAITAVDQPDPYANNDSASVTLNRPAVTEASFTLKAGWNLISLPMIPNDGTITVVLTGSVWTNFERALTYDRCTDTWSSYIKGGPTPGFTVMADGKGYWIKMATGYAGGVVTFSGKEQLDPPALPKNYNVCVGWNMIGFKELQSIAAGSYLSNINYVRIWSFANGAYSPLSSADMMQPGLGYWVAITAAGVIYP